MLFFLGDLILSGGGGGGEGKIFPNVKFGEKHREDFCPRRSSTSLVEYLNHNHFSPMNDVLFSWREITVATFPWKVFGINSFLGRDIPYILGVEAAVLQITF